MPRLASTYSPDALPWCWVAQQDPPTTCNALPFAFAAGSRPPFCFRVCYWRSGMLLAPVVMSQLLDRYDRGTGRHRWGNDRVNSFAGRAVDRAARSWRFDRRAPAFCWQRAGTRSSRRRGMEVGAVAAVAARWVPPIGQHLGCAPRSRRQRGHACHPRSPPRPSSSPPATPPSRRLPASVAMMCDLRHQVELPSA